MPCLIGHSYGPNKSLMSYLRNSHNPEQIRAAGNPYGKPRNKHDLAARLDTAYLDCLFLALSKEIIYSFRAIHYDRSDTPAKRQAPLHALVRRQRQYVLKRPVLGNSSRCAARFREGDDEARF